MKNKEYSMKPSIQWVRPVPMELMQRSFVTNEPDDFQKKIDAYDEIFPEKDKMKDINGKQFKETNDTFHRAMAPVLTVGQCFGILPVIGIRKSNASDLKFSWFSWKVSFTLISMCCCIFVSAMCLVRMIVKGVDLFKTISLVFYLSTLMVLILFLRLAPKWPALVMTMSRNERPKRLTRRSLRTRVKLCCFAILFPALISTVFYVSTLMVLILFLRLAPKWPALVMTMSRNERPKRLTRRSLRTRISLCCFGILFPALLEHILAILAGFAVAYDCSFGRHLTESYFVNCYPQVFDFTEYALWKGVLLQIINLESTFNWNYMDLFIIVISLGLTDRFNQLNKRLEAAKGKNLPEQFWKLAREEYAHLSRLVREVDTAINEIVLLSFANNLYFICVQLFNSLKPLRGLSNIIYFGFSFGFLMTRSLAVSLGAARIHSAARQPASSLYAAPSSSYGNEAQRFLEQVVTDDVALTGLNFFNVTRGLVLTIAGTIVTYELVLVQFNTAPQPVTANITINENSCGVPIKS